MSNFHINNKRSINIENNMDIAKLTTLMKEYIAQSNERNRALEFQFLFSLLAPINIRIRYELHVDNKEETREITPQDSSSEPGELRIPDYQFLNSPNVTVGRVVLTNFRNRSKYDYELAFQCNGAVLDSATWDVISLPPRAFNPNINIGHVASNIHKYTIYQIIDGTAITLYHYKGSWRMASTNGFEVNGYKWMGPKTYEQIFGEVTKGYPQFSLDKLDKSLSYSLIMRSNEFHPLLDDPSHIHLVQAADPKTGAVSYPDVGLPKQNGFPAPQYDFLQHANKENRGALKEFLTNRTKIHYGFILRGSFGELGAYSNVVMESELLKKVRQLFYNMPDLQKHLTVPLDHTNREALAVLKNFLHYDNRNTFINLFRQYEEKFRDYESLVSKLVNRIQQYYRNRTTKLKTGGNSPSRGGKDPCVGPGGSSTGGNSGNNVAASAGNIDRLAEIFVQHISGCGHFNPFDINAKKIIYDYVVDPYYTELYYSILK
jgi:hypothetical protein